MAEGEKENIFNIPNALTLLRVILAFVAVYFIFADFHIIFVVVAFSVAMITDFFDGWTARKFNAQTEFGRQFDVVADRVVIGGVPIVFLVKYSLLGVLGGGYVLQILFMFIREIITIPIGIITMFLGIPIPQVRFIGKLVTLMESIVFPMVLLGAFYNFFSFSIYLAIATGFAGVIASIYYIYDIRKLIIEKITQNNNNLSA